MKAMCINVRECVITFWNNCVSDSLESLEPTTKNEFCVKNLHNELLAIKAYELSGESLESKSENYYTKEANV